MSNLNHKFELAARPVGMPKRTDWNYKEEPVRDPGEGEFLVKILYISLDPAMRGWMNEGKSYIAPVGIGEVMRAGALGRVTASKNPKFAVGDHVYGGFRRSRVRHIERHRHHESKRRRDSSAGFSRHARNAGDDRLFWLVGYRPAETWPDRSRFRRSRGSGHSCRANRQDKGMHRGRHRRRRGKVQLHCEGSRL